MTNQAPGEGTSTAEDALFGARNAVVLIGHILAEQDAVALLRGLSVDTDEIMILANTIVNCLSLCARAAIPGVPDEVLKTGADLHDQLSSAVFRSMAGGLDLNRPLHSNTAQALRNASTAVERLLVVLNRLNRAGHNPESAGHSPQASPGVKVDPGARRLTELAASRLPTPACARYRDEYAAELYERARISRRAQWSYVLGVLATAWMLCRALRDDEETPARRKTSRTFTGSIATGLLLVIGNWPAVAAVGVVLAAGVAFVCFVVGNHDRTNHLVKVITALRAAPTHPKRQAARPRKRTTE
jgi:hypothetical protein